MTSAEEVQKGRAIYKLLAGKNGYHSKYVFDKGGRRARWVSVPGKPWFSRQDVLAWFSITSREADRLVTLYRITRPEINETDLELMVKVIVRGQLKPMDIIRIRNQTARKEAMEAYGMEKLIKDGGGKLVQQDDYGTLWEIEGRDGADRVGRWVEVVNSTPEPDGHFARYFLRVPPRTASAREGVAWIGGYDRATLKEFAGFAAQS